MSSVAPVTDVVDNAVGVAKSCWFVAIVNHNSEKQSSEKLSKLLSNLLTLFCHLIFPTFFSEEEICDLLSKAVDKADSKISDYIEVNSDSFGMGTTMLLAVIKDSNLYISWCGDSHCYNYKGGELHP